MKNTIKQELVSREGAPFKTKDIPILSTALNEILVKKGSISSKDVVKKAKPKKSTIHKFFKWDDKEAGNEFRLQQARNIINHFEYLVTAKNQKPFRMPAFQSVIAIQGKPKVYLPAESIVSVQNYADQVVNRFLSMLQGISSNLQGFRDYAWIVVILNSTMQKVQKGLKKKKSKKKSKSKKK
jgi:hypothetical protein